MKVWLPKKFNPTASRTGYGSLPDEQLDAVINHLRSLGSDLVCPEPLGRREIFRWRLREELVSGEQKREALEDFSLLVEGLLYGLLESETYDLNSSGFNFRLAHDRHLIALTFRSAPGTTATAAGFFSPTTLVCPAANWKNKSEFRDRVQAIRMTQDGFAARALLAPFRSQFAGHQTLWTLALDWVLREYGASPLDPGEANQRNIGPFLLELAPGATPDQLFFPCYWKGRLAELTHRFQGADYSSTAGSVSVHNGTHLLCTVATPTSAHRPALYGLGSVAVAALNGGLPHQTTFTSDSKNKFNDYLTTVIGSYSKQWSEPPARRRFLIPDSLRVVFHAMGNGGVAFLTGANSPWIYSDAYNAMSWTTDPHIVSGEAGKHGNGRDSYFVAGCEGNRNAVYVESWEGTALNELSSLGYALWRIFKQRPSSTDPDSLTGQLLRNQSGRISAQIGVAVQDVDRVNELLSWRYFLGALATQPDELFRSAGLAYAAKNADTQVEGKPLSTFEDLSIYGHTWRVPRP